MKFKQSSLEFELVLPCLLLFYKVNQEFFQVVSISVLLYGCATWTLMKCLEKRVAGNYSRILCAVLNKSWKQHPTIQQLCGHLLPIWQTIQIRWERHIGHSWRSKYELISDILLWTTTHGHTSVAQPAKMYIQQLCVDTGCFLENIFRAIFDRDRWHKRVKEIHDVNISWRWWWWYWVTISF